MIYESTHNNSNNSFSITILLSILIFLIYSNTFNASWHLDDYQNIVNNTKLHITTISTETIYNATHAEPNGSPSLYRPVACLSFAINWLFSGDKLWGFHLTNTAIHILSAIVLLFTVKNILSTPYIYINSDKEKIFIAALCATLWSCHPIQTQAVTYIVQRMASLATLFSLLSMLFFIKGRLSTNKLKIILFFFLSFISFALAFGSKENSLLLPLSMVLIELSFFHEKFFISKINISKVLIVTTLSFLIITIGYFLLYEKFPSINADGRSFTIKERLLTEPRVILFYLSQIFIPTPERFSITHDIIVSKYLFSPPTTIISIISIISIIFFSIKCFYKNRIITFSILFFFINHIVESTIIPLELIFEHRNYLPSLFLFLPIAYGINILIYRIYSTKLLMKNIIIFFILSIIIAISVGTLDRNYAWLSEKTLWKDAMQKAPKSARPVHNLAWGYYSKIGDFDSAIELYNKSLSLEDPNKHHTAITHSNIAEIYFKKGKFDDAVQHWKESIRLFKKYWKPYYGICKTLIIQGQWQKALDWANHSLANDIVSADLLLSKGLIHLQLNQPEKAISSFNTLLNHENLSYSARVGLGLSFLMLKNHAAAKISFNLARKESPLDIKPLLGLIVVEDQLGNTETANKFIDILLNIHDDQKIIQILDQLFGEVTAFPFPKKELTFIIKERLRERASRQLVSLE